MTNKPYDDEKFSERLKELGLSNFECIEDLEGNVLEDFAEGSTEIRTVGVLLTMYLLTFPGSVERCGLIAMGVPGETDTVRLAAVGDSLDIWGLDARYIERLDDRSMILRLKGLNTQQTVAIIAGDTGLSLDLECLSNPSQKPPGRILRRQNSLVSSDDVQLAGELPSLEPLRPFLEGDPWLEGLAARAEQGGLYYAAVFTGVLRRHYVVSNPISVVEQLLAGEDPAHIKAARAWSAALSNAHANKLLQMTLEELDSLERDLRDAWSHFDPDSALWRGTLVGLAERRSTLEDVVSVLGMRGEAYTLGASISALDRDGARLVAAAPPIPEARSRERLQRARFSEPDAWWTRL